VEKGVRRPPLVRDRRAFVVQGKGATEMANHLTPEELSKELGIDRLEVIRVCIEESIPIYHGKIDKTLFQAHLQASQAMQAAG
jgi:hypothetical protein